MEGDRQANEELLLLHEQRAMVLDLLHAVEVVGMMPDSNQEAVEAIVETLREILAEVEAHRRGLGSAGTD
jgi:hypothetical protein